MILNRAVAWHVVVCAVIAYAFTLAALMITWMVNKIGAEATRAMIRRV